MTDTIEAVVMGRVCADLYPAEDQVQKPLHEIERFERYVGGFAGNVATGLARLGVRTAIASRVGDDGHGRFVRDFLEAEGVDTAWLATDPDLRTALAFCEVWPPDHFPITFYRTPTCPDWRLAREDLSLPALVAAPLMLTTGTGLARSPSRETTLEVMASRVAGQGTSVFDLDYRPALWESERDYSLYAGIACRLADVVVGNGDELRAATGLEDEREASAALMALGPELVVAKRGQRGCAVHTEQGVIEVPALEVPVVNGLGAGDAFAAGFSFGLLRGSPAEEAATFGNAAGAIVATRISCSTAMPTEKDVRALLRDEGREG